MSASSCHADGQGPCAAACCPIAGSNPPAFCPDVIHDPCLWSGGPIRVPPMTPGLPDPKLVVGQWRADVRQAADDAMAAAEIERKSWLLDAPQPDPPIELHHAIWMLPDDTSLEDAYALLHAATVRIWRECLDLRERWANNTDPAHAGAAIPRAVAYQYVAGQLGRAIDGARAVHQPKEHP